MAFHLLGRDSSARLPGVLLWGTSSPKVTTRRVFTASFLRDLKPSWDSEDESDIREHQPPIDKFILAL